MIKYRVYDTQEKKYRDDLYFFITQNGELLWSYELMDGLYPADPQRFIIEQYTGLKDKNGVEIAVGDIIECVDKGLEDTEVERDVVSDLTNILSVLYKMGELEVIGNIHDNAELLEEK